MCGGSLSHQPCSLLPLTVVSPCTRSSKLSSSGIFLGSSPHRSFLHTSLYFPWQNFPWPWPWQRETVFLLYCLRSLELTPSLHIETSMNKLPILRLAPFLFSHCALNFNIFSLRWEMSIQQRWWLDASLSQFPPKHTWNKIADIYNAVFVRGRKIEGYPYNHV